MSVLCSFGLHKWKPHYRALTRPAWEEFEILIVPSLFAGPPRMVPTGIHYLTKRKLVCYYCERCKATKPTSTAEKDTDEKEDA